MAKANKIDAVETASFKLPRSIIEDLSFIAEHEDRSKSSVIRRALLKYLEDQHDLKILEEAYRDHELTAKKTYTLEDIKKENDL